MANTNNPYGFKHIGYLPGYAPDYQLKSGVIAAANGTKIYFGDPVVQLSTGYVGQGVNGASVSFLGIFQGCDYLNASGQMVFSPYWPGSAQADATCRYIGAPGAMFMVQANAGPVAFADIGQMADFTVGTGSTVGGCFSGASLSNLGTTSTLPFIVLGLQGGLINAGGVGGGLSGAGGNGTDNTTAYNNVIVAFNQQAFRAGVTGV
jgi:hypothetical protein